MAGQLMQAQRLIPDDFASVSDLFMEAWAESKYRDRAVDTNRAAHVIKTFLANPRLFARGLLDGDGRVVGAMFGEVAHTTWWDMDLVATSHFLYVLPQHRGRGVALIRAFIRWAKRAGAKRVNVSVSAGIDNDRAGALLKKVGLHQTGVAFEMEI